MKWVIDSGRGITISTTIFLTPGVGFRANFFHFKGLHQLIELNEATAKQKSLFEKIAIPEAYLTDYRTRRAINRTVNLSALSLV